MKLFIVVPAFNEELVIKGVIEGLKKEYENVIVVDDGSTDRTAEVAEIAGAKVYKHIINRGQGAALTTGMEAALLNNARIIVHFDADGQMRVEDIARVIEPIIQNNADIAIGSRFLDYESNIPPLRKILLRGAIIFTWITSGLKLTDAHNGFRAFSVKAARLIKIRQDKMAHASEIINEVARLKLRYKEVPVVVRYTDYSISRGQKLTGAFKIVLDLLKAKFLKI